jgi:hypothetical protein
MSVNISVSNTKQYDCSEIIQKLLLSNINARVIETRSIVDRNIENGCLITVDKEFSNKDKIDKLWNIIKDHHTCAHLQIDGLFNGCILNYIYKDNCPGSQ